MSRKKTHQPIYITVEPTTNQDKQFLARMSNYFVLLSLLLLGRYAGIDIPDILYLIFGSAVAGLELGQMYNLIRRK